MNVQICVINGLSSIRTEPLWIEKVKKDDNVIKLVLNYSVDNFALERSDGDVTDDYALRVESRIPENKVIVNDDNKHLITNGEFRNH